MWGPLDQRNGFEEYTSGVQTIEQGAGRFVLTDNFSTGDVYQQVKGLIGRPDQIRYRFGKHTIVLRRVTDNTVTVEVTP